MSVVPEVAVSALMQTGAFIHEAQLLPNARAVLEELMRERVPAGLPVRPIVAYGSVYKEILRAAAALPANLIVMAAHPVPALRQARKPSIVRSSGISSRSPKDMASGCTSRTVAICSPGL
jgi:nucleotide-binding universal stress UspA family protein